MGFNRVGDMQAWMEQNRLDKDQLTVALAALCNGVTEELKKDTTVHREQVFPPAIVLPVRLVRL